jgi:hypothetical protein
MAALSLPRAFSYACLTAFRPLGLPILLQLETPISVHGRKLLYLHVGSCNKRLRTSVALQIEVFKAQVELARELERPVSIHCVRAFGELQDILR